MILYQVSSREAEFLQKILPGLYKNLQRNPQTLLTKYYGMFAYQVRIDMPLKLYDPAVCLSNFFLWGEHNCFQSLQAGLKKIRLVVMENLFPSGVKMHLKFDLKGSTHGRKVIQIPFFNSYHLSLFVRHPKRRWQRNLQPSRILISLTWSQKASTLTQRPTQHWSPP